MFQKYTMKDGLAYLHILFSNIYRKRRALSSFRNASGQSLVNTQLLNVATWNNIEVNNKPELTQIRIIWPLN